MSKVSPRSVPDRDSKYMGVAYTIAGFSKDPSTQIGALVIDEDNEPRGWGYNGPPADIADDDFSWERPEKYDYVRHAEENAIDHSHGKLKGCTLYCTAFPCKRCMLYIVKKKIKRVVYLERPYDAASMQSNNADFLRSMEIARKAKVQVEVFQGDINWLNEWVEKGKVMGLLRI